MLTKWCCFSSDIICQTNKDFSDAEPGSELNAVIGMPEFPEMDVAIGSGAGDNILTKTDAPGHCQRATGIKTRPKAHRSWRARDG